MQYRRLGLSNLDVSVLAFGAWQIGDSTYWGADTEADAQRTIDAAIDAGITLFDTAEMYGQGEAERVLGRCLGSKRSRVVVASKVWPDKCAPDLLRANCEASLQRLQIDAIDLYQIHWPPRDLPFDDVYATLRDLQQEGKIREVGVSNFGAVDLETWVTMGCTVSNQLGYNLLFRAIEHEIIPACERNMAGILVYMPLMQGLLAGRWDSPDEVPMMRRRTRHFAGTREGTRHGEPGCEELTFQTLRDIRRVADLLGQPVAALAIAWAVAQPSVTSVIVGGRRPDQLKCNLEALTLVLPEDVLAELDRVTEPLKNYFGRNADMWDSEVNKRIR